MKYLALATCIAISFPAHALTLDEAVNTALKNHPIAMKATSQVESYRHRADSASGEMFPSLTATIGRTRTTTDGSETNSGAEALNLSYILYAGGSISAAKDKAELTAKAASFSRAETLAELRKNVTTAYALAVRNIQLKASYDEQLASAETLVRYSEAKYKAGILLYVDLLKAKTDRHAVLASLIGAQADLDESLATLGYFVGRTVTAQELTPPELPDTNTRKEQLIEEALANNAELRSMEKQILAGEKSIAVRDAAFLPTVTLSASGGRYHNDSLAKEDYDQSQIGVNLSWNLFNGGSDKSEQYAAKSDLMALKHSLADKKEQLRKEITALAGKIDSLKVKAASVAELMQYSKENHAMTLASFEIGKSSVIEVTKSRDQLESASMQESNTRYELFQATAQLQALLHSGENK